jgi:NifB/MoaA-like Fe-S oxidoreductase
MIILIRNFPAPLDTLYEWQPGDHITHLDGRPLEDILDLYYYNPEGEETVLGLKRKGGQRLNVTMKPGDIDAVTSCFAPMEFKTCSCDCVFCFVDQNPKGMRDQIYVKDEDYRFSFLYGNYITMTSLGKRGIARIIEQRMSPLFVSVHATDIDVRTRMLGIKRKMDVVAMLKELADAGIEIHTQVVLCPGWNDGAVLEKTFRDLVSLGIPADDDEEITFAIADHGDDHDDDEDWDPNALPTAAENAVGGIRSLAVVPVGLSSHREGLTELTPVEIPDAEAAITAINGFQNEAKEQLGYSFIYLSDEFYLLTGAPFPDQQSYDGFWQVDSAIGLTPRLRDEWRECLEWRKEDNDLPTRPLTVLTGLLAAKAWEREFRPVLESYGTPAVEVVGITNTFYGSTVTVAGLLSGKDIRDALLQLPQHPPRDVVLSPRVLNSDGLTLDGLTLENLADDQPHTLHVGEEEGFIDFWAELG